VTFDVCGVLSVACTFMTTSGELAADTAMSICMASAVLVPVEVV
jgi:hypothetical protein